MLDDVTRLLVDVAATAIVPRFRALTACDVDEKSPGEPVTVADREAERLITDGLRSILDIPVVGEEATATDPRLLDALRVARSVWLVDPIDGTADFIAGRPNYAIMAALVRAGQTVASWIVLPAHGRNYVAESGGGTYRDGEKIRLPTSLAGPAGWRAAAPTRFLTPAAAAQLAANADRFAALTQGSGCAGVDYAGPPRRRGGRTALPADTAMGSRSRRAAGHRSRWSRSATRRRSIPLVRQRVRSSGDRRSRELATDAVPAAATWAGGQRLILSARRRRRAGHSRARME